MPSQRALTPHAKLGLPAESSRRWLGKQHPCQPRKVAIFRGEESIFRRVTGIIARKTGAQKSPIEIEMVNIAQHSYAYFLNKLLIL